VATRDILGEIVVVLAGATRTLDVGVEVVRAALLDQFAHGASVRDAVTEVVAALGVVHRETYDLALALRAASKDG